MNTAMWEHPITARQVEQLKGFGYTEIPCVVKKLVCGDEGQPFPPVLWLFSCPYPYPWALFCRVAFSMQEGSGCSSLRFVQNRSFALGLLLSVILGH